MGRRYTEAQAKASAKYIAGHDEIKIRLPKGMKDEWKQLAKAQGKSLNQFIIDCVEKGS